MVRVMVKLTHEYKEPRYKKHVPRVQPTVTFPLMTMLTFCMIIKKRDHQKF